MAEASLPHQADGIYAPSLRQSGVGSNEPLRPEPPPVAQVPTSEGVSNDPPMWEWTMGRESFGEERPLQGSGLSEAKLRIEIHQEHDQDWTYDSICALHIFGDTHVMNWAGISPKHDGRCIVYAGSICPGTFPDFDAVIKKAFVFLIERVHSGQRSTHLNVWCRHGRHRSMITGWTMGRLAASMGFEATVAIPKTLDRKNRTRLCTVSGCRNCHAVGARPFPALNPNEKRFAGALSLHFQGIPEDRPAKPLFAAICSEWEV